MISGPSVSVVVPTLNASDEIRGLLESLLAQSLRPIEVIVIDSESDDGTARIAAGFPKVRVISIRRSEFNHGATRHRALLETSGEIVCFITQDAMPASADYLRHLIEPMMVDESVALVSGRQLPKADARPFERLVRTFNYPDEPTVRSKADLVRYGIKTFFASDVCSAYRKTAYLECGGFSSVQTNEDMLMAARFISAGWKVAYEPTAEVYHSHNMTLGEQFKRNKLVGMFLEEHSEDLLNVSEVGEGGRLVAAVSSQLLRERQIGELIAFGMDCAARLLGNRAGRTKARKKKEIGVQ